LITTRKNPMLLCLDLLLVENHWRRVSLWNELSHPRAGYASKVEEEAIMLHKEALIEKFTSLFCTLKKSKHGSQSAKLLSHVKSLVIIVAKIIICFYLTMRKDKIKYSNQVPASSIPRDNSLPTRPWTLIYSWKYQLC